MLGNGDGGAFTTADDLHRFWLALLAGRSVSRPTVEEMTRPRHDVPDENMRYGMGFWVHRTHPALVLGGYDAGASFRSTHVIETQTTVSVLGDSSEGVWPVIAALARAIACGARTAPTAPPRKAPDPARHVHAAARGGMLTVGLSRAMVRHGDEGLPPRSWQGQGWRLGQP